MSKLRKPRFHDEECFGLITQDDSQIMEAGLIGPQEVNTQNSVDLIHSAQRHFSEQNMKASIDDIISAYESLLQDKTKLTALRNQVLRDLSTAKGWQAAPHPQALRLWRSTPSIPLRSSQIGRLI